MSCCYDRFVLYFGNVIVLFCILYITETLALRDVKTHIPPEVNRGDTAWVNCSFDMEGEELYYIKHFFNGIEFYRFVSYIKENPIVLYPVGGIYVDKGKSSFGHVFLYTTDLDSEGNYTCEVSSEAPVFEQKRSSSSFMQVNVPPEDNPIITGIGFQYAIGENLTGTCTSARSKPPSILKWYINDREARCEFVMSRLSSYHPDSIVSVISDIQFTVQSYHFSGREMILRCTSFFKDHENSQIIVIKEKNKNSHWNHEKAQASVSLTCTAWPPLLFILLLSRQLMRYVDKYLLGY
ncbi:uncharacterized protein LOC143225202 [Tachypleus tridentatus]|uniref:uncharacterized protein LOC143225202 n=1 Tax=Tachypleus tridentatus TaxID=6853 RepID=UPI003FD0A843